MIKIANGNKKSVQDSTAKRISNAKQPQVSIPAAFPVISAVTPTVMKKSACPCDGGCPRCTPTVKPRLTISRIGHVSPRIQRQTSPEDVAGQIGQEFRSARRRDLARIIAGMRFRKILRDCPAQSGVRLQTVLNRMGGQISRNQHCLRFFRQHFNINPLHLLRPNSRPTIMVDPRLPGSGRTRCPSPSVRIQPAICRSRWRERVIMHELTHFAGCLTSTRTPSTERLAEEAEDICIGTRQQILNRGQSRQTP
jgi:hypothetical protein